MNATDKKPRKSDSGYVAVAIGVLIVILFIGFGWYFSGQPGPAQQQPSSQANEQAGTSDENEADTAGDAGTDAQQQAAAQPGEPLEIPKAGEDGQKDASSGVVPTFDTIRIESNGDTVVAGQAAPGANVTLYANSEAVASAVADAGGNWAMVLDKPLAAGNSDLWISAEKGGDATRSEQQLAVVIDPDGASTPLVVVQDDEGSRVMQEAREVASARTAEPVTEKPASETTMDAGGQMAAKDAGGQMAAKNETSGDTAPQPAAQDTDEKQMAARSGSMSDGAPTTASGETAARIEAADYDDDGNLYISGRAAPGATVRLYYDNELLGDATAGEDGRWSLSGERPLDGKVHTLRVDQLEAGTGSVASRAEVSLIAEIPGEAKPPQGREQQVAAAGDARGGDDGQASNEGSANAAGTSSGTEQTSGAAEETPDAPAKPRRFTVKRGDNLWRIARDYYGRGIRYTTIFEANKDQIRDPDLIYPEQVFLIPRRVEGATASN